MVLGQRDASVLRRFEGFCALEGLGPDLALRDAHVIEAFLQVGCCGLAPHTLGTYRSVLRRLGGAGPATRRFPASPAAPPYDAADVAALWSRARHQSSEQRVTNATVLLAATLGAGLRPRELALVRDRDVVRDRERALIEVRGAHPRTVPVRPPYAGPLVKFAKDRRGYLFRPRAKVRDTKNLVGEIAATIARDPDEVRTLSGRCRSTFICSHLQAHTPLGELCALAGLGGVESLLRYARHVEGAPHSKAALRAQRSREWCRDQ